MAYIIFLHPISTVTLTGVSSVEQKGWTKDVRHSCGISGPARLVSLGQDKQVRVQLVSIFFIIFSHRINDGKSLHKGETTVPSRELIIYKVINLFISNSWIWMKLQPIWPLIPLSCNLLSVFFITKSIYGRFSLLTSPSHHCVYALH